MANIYYSQTGNRGGILRAVLSSEESGWMLKKHSAQFAGQQFPTQGHDVGADFAVLRIFQGEMSQEWQAGFYLFDDGVMQIEEAVHSCNAKAAVK